MTHCAYGESLRFSDRAIWINYAFNAKFALLYFRFAPPPPKRQAPRRVGEGLVLCAPFQGRENGRAIRDGLA